MRKWFKIEWKSETAQRFVVACSHLTFESCVVLEGNQSPGCARSQHGWFESCAVLEGNQSPDQRHARNRQFESCVVLEGNQSFPIAASKLVGFESCVVLEGNQLDGLFLPGRSAEFRKTGRWACCAPLPSCFVL